DAPPFVQPRKLFVRVDLPAGIDPQAGPSAVAEALRPWLRGERKVEIDGRPTDLFAAVIVPEDIADHVSRPGGVPRVPEPGESVQYWAANLADTDLRTEIERAINDQQRRAEYVAKGMDAAAVQTVQRTSVPVVKLDPRKASGREQVSLADQLRQWAPVGFVYLLWTSIFAVASLLLNNTIEEKSNRLVEVLLSSVTPGELMFGKLLGIAAVGLTMILAWIAGMVGMLWWNAGPQAEQARSLLDVVTRSGLLPAFVGYFVLGTCSTGACFWRSAACATRSKRRRT
ncbi:MAG: ABC transporter permease, partial [Planctomycetia bacterium]